MDLFRCSNTRHLFKRSTGPLDPAHRCPYNEPSPLLLVDDLLLTHEVWGDLRSPDRFSPAHATFAIIVLSNTTQEEIESIGDHGEALV